MSKSKRDEKGRFRPLLPEEQSQANYDKIEDFWSYLVDKSGGPDACWPYIGKYKVNGYGRLWIGDKGRSKPIYIYAHILAYKLETGLNVLEIDHKCRNRICCNPKHLRSVTRKQNIENHNGAARSDNETTGIRGVTFNVNRNRYVAQVKHYGKHYTVGYFDNLEDAETAVKAKRRELFTHNDVDTEKAN